MRNLQIRQYITLQTRGLGRVSRCAWDAVSESVVFACGPSEDNSLIELRRCSLRKAAGGTNFESSIIAAWDAPCPTPDLLCDHVLDVHYFSDTRTACLVLTGGDIIVVREQGNEENPKIEIVGSVDAGIAAACWAPDEELLLICTKAKTLLFMTQGFDNVARISIQPDDLKLSKHVSVGWGKAETQFRGKGAKAMRDPTMPETEEKGNLSSKEDYSTHVSWRGDGQYVALNSLQASDRRVIRIYSREGVLDGVTEPVDCLEGALSWRPSGNLISGIQRNEKGANVIFFERNGLKHGEFSLRLNEKDLNSWASSITLSWNLDSSILAVTYLDRVHLWTMGNHHYYLKSEVRPLNAVDTGPMYFRWHSERPNLFAISHSGGGGYINVLEYGSVICRGSVIPPYDYGAVAVIDGDKLKLTDMRYSNVPPPMASHDVSLHSLVIDCAIKSTGTRKARIAALTNNNIYVVDWTINDPSVSPVVLASLDHKSTFRSQTSARQRHLRRIIFGAVDKLVLLYSEGTDSFISVISIPDGKAEFIDERLSSDFQQVVQSEDDHQFYLSLINGDILAQTTSDFLFNVVKSAHLLRSCDSFEIISSQALGTAKDRLSKAGNNFLVVSLTQNGQLHADGRILAKNCTSYLCTKDHIIFTTSMHLLKFVHLDYSENLEVPADTPEADERCRSIERGARIVTTVPSKSALILQMPRGNLETIYPRALVLAEIRRSLNLKHYKRAFLSCRSHRVDMNIISDHNPDIFLEDVRLFVEQLDKVEYIDLFLSQLRNEDVSKNMYKDTIKKPGSAMEVTPTARPSKTTAVETKDLKTNRICTRFIEVLRTMPGSRYQSLITAHVCKDPPDYVSGLREVSKLQQTGAEEIESAIEHICFLVDVNKLFEAALGLYDLNLALIVAQHSQKDPREYLPFLNNLQSKSSLEMKFDIDNHLGRRRLCLQHLYGMKASEDLKRYTVKYDLYEDALVICKYDETATEDIMKLYADYLAQKSKHREAGVAYEYLKNYKSACESYQLAHLWRESITAGQAALFDKVQIRTLAQNLSEELIVLKDYFAAGIIAVEYLQDVAAGAKLFCRGYHFSEALRVLSLHERRDLIDEIVDTGLAEGMAAMTELIAEFKAQLNAQVPRIQELRIKKEQEPLSFFDATANDDKDIPDNISLAATDASTAGGTLFTRYTNRTGTIGTNATRRTSKNKRREERKKARGKKGSVYEEDYLISSVGRLIERVNTVQDDISRLIMGLLQRRMKERARALQEAMIAVIDLCRISVTEVFVEATSQGIERNQEGGSTERQDLAEEKDWNSIEALRGVHQCPAIKSFERLLLI